MIKSTPIKQSQKNQRHHVWVIGPTTPYRGGIAQYNDQLARSLSAYCDVECLSFKRLYPKFLYPGASDKEVNLSPTETGPTVYRVLDAYWPPTLTKAVNVVAKSSPDAVIITWWTLFWQPGLAYVARRLRKKGIKVVYVCHNVFDHDAKRIVRWLSRLFLGQADAYIVHATTEENRIHEIYPAATIFNTRSLPVSSSFPKPEGKLAKRGKLELLFFGFIRPYKGLEVLLSALAKLSPEQQQQIHATIVGESWNGAKAVRQAVEDKKLTNIDLRIEYVATKEAAEYFGRADVVVLPYVTATGSAVASQAYFYRKPILGSAVGGIKEVVTEGKTGWLVKPGSVSELTAAISGLSRKQAEAMQQDIDRFNSRHSWSTVAQEYATFLRDLK